MALWHLQLFTAIASLGIAALVSADMECGSSVMFGAPWQPTNPYYIQESAWKNHGNITRINLYYNSDSGCLLGVKPTYGSQPDNARRLGIEKKADGTQLVEADLELDQGESINKADFKFGKCITYLSLHSNTGREVSVGNPQAVGPLQTSVPDSDEGFLAYFKAYTNEPMVASGNVGKLQQLQLIWGAKVCAPTIPSMNPMQQQEDRDASVKRTMSPASAVAVTSVSAPDSAEETADQQQPVIEEVPEGDVTDVTADQTTSSAPAAATPTPATFAPEPAAAAAPQPAAAAAPKRATAAPKPAAAAPKPAAAAAPKPATAAPKPAVAAPKPAAAAAKPAKAGPKPAAAATWTPNPSTPPMQPAAASWMPNPSAAPTLAPWLPNPTAPPKPAAAAKPNPSAPPKQAATDLTGYLTPDSDMAVAPPVAVTDLPVATANPSTPPVAAPNPSTPPPAAAVLGYPAIVLSPESGSEDASSVTITELPVEVTSPLTPPAAAVSGKSATEITVSEVTATQSASEVAKCSSLSCPQGACPTASCALNGLGKDVVTMMCFGTNIVPAPMIDLNVQNACTNLACKLDRPNCTSSGVLGIGGFCTGRVVAMGTTAKLHPSGMAFLGYPCMESKSIISDMVPVIGDYTAKGTYIAKAWKVCDCINGFGLANNSVAFRTHKGGSVTFNPPKFPTLPHFPFINRALINMSMSDVLAQWVVANQNEAKVPQVSITTDETDELKTIIVDFNVPAVLVPKISMPLFKMPQAFPLPVFTIPIGNKTLTRVAKILPDMTSLPTIVMPKWKLPNLSLPKFVLPQVTVPNLNDLAQDWGVPIMPKLPPLPKMSISDMAAQWLAANQLDLPVPKIGLPDFKIGTLKNIIPDFKVPSMVVANISAPLLHLPSPFSMPVFTLPSDGDTLAAIAELFPKLNSLPHFMVPDKEIRFKLPSLTLPNVTVPDFEDVIHGLGAILPQPKVPTFSAQNFTVPNLLPGGLPKFQFPPKLGIPSTINLTTPAFKVPGLSSMVTAVSNLPDLKLDWTQWPNVLDSWRQHYLENPAGFDLSSFMDVMKSNPAINKMVDNFNVSIDVPDFLAPWVAGVAEKAPLPVFNVPESLLIQLKSIIPSLPDVASLIVVNMTSPYVKSDQTVTNLPTIVIPDALVPKVHQILPNLTNIPSLLIPDGQSIQFNLTLPDITSPELLKQLSPAAAGAIAASAQAPTQATVETPAPAPAPEQPVAADHEHNTNQPDQSMVTHPKGPPPAATPAAPTGKPVVMEAPPVATPPAPAAAPVVATDTRETVTEVPEATATRGTFTSAPAGGASVVAVTLPPQAQRMRSQSSQQAQHMDSALVVDDEGAVRLDMGGPGMETAFMDPKDFYALDKATQKAMRAMFVS